MAERRYGGKTADERRAERREQLLDAAVELFGTQGYAATTIEMLCRRAALNPRYFYEQFESREALLGAVYDRHADGVLERVVAALDDAPPDARGRLETGLRAFVDGTLSDPRLARINYFEMVGVNPRLEARRRAVLRSYADLMTAQLDAIPPGDRPALTHPRLAAIAFVGAVDGLITDALAADPPTARDEIITTLLELLVPLIAD